MDGWSGPNSEFETGSLYGLLLGGAGLATNGALLEKAGGDSMSKEQEAVGHERSIRWWLFVGSGCFVGPK